MCIYFFESVLMLLTKIIKINQFLSKLQLAILGAFFETQYITIDNSTDCYSGPTHSSDWLVAVVQYPSGLSDSWLRGRQSCEQRYVKCQTFMTIIYAGESIDRTNRRPYIIE